jgi:hypothetical protein
MTPEATEAIRAPTQPVEGLRDSIVSQIPLCSLETLSGHSCGSWFSPEGAVRTQPGRFHRPLTRTGGSMPV